MPIIARFPENRTLSKSTKTAGQVSISSKPAAMMADLARSHPRRGASRRLKRRFLTSCVAFGGVPSRLRSWLLLANSLEMSKMPMN
eukprot:9222447-Heterocapsa_arctica.AAC.1